MATLELKELRKSYGDTEVIHGVNLEIESGEFCVFVGPSGCGKSTMLRMIAGLEDITAGNVEIAGDVVTNVPAAQRGLAMVFQSYALYPHMSVKQNLSFGLENLRMDREEIERRVAEAARMLQIEELMQRKPGQLSGGQRQRVAIGRTVVREPKVFLFDEPLSNLDAELRVAMRGEIAALHKRLGNTMVYVTHDQVEAMTMADKIAVMRAGIIEQYGTPLDLYNFPANTFVAGFIGSPRMNFISGTITARDDKTVTLALTGDHRVALDASRFGGVVGDGVEMGVRANHLEIAKSDKDADLTVAVETVEQLGGETYLYGTVGGAVAFTVNVQGQSEIKSGDTVPVRLKPELVHLFSKSSTLSLLKSA
ncbi:MAG: ABC transporter ATP-binding protein [Alphaproteobacteria bacterium]